jgi:hypothetical protein
MRTTILAFGIALVGLIMIAVGSGAFSFWKPKK